MEENASDEDEGTEDDDVGVSGTNEENLQGVDSLQLLDQVRFITAQIFLCKMWSGHCLHVILGRSRKVSEEHLFILFQAHPIYSKI